LAGASAAGLGSGGSVGSHIHLDSSAPAGSAVQSL
jgi:hypothetical protein